MTLSQFLNETVTLRKITGETYPFKAQVQPTLIVTDNDRLPVEEGDRIERQLTNGMIETYVVLDRILCRNQRYSSTLQDQSKKGRHST